MDPLKGSWRPPEGFLGYILRILGAEDKELFSIICVCVYFLNYILQIEKLRHFAKLMVECNAFTSKERWLVPVDTFPRSLWSFFTCGVLCLLQSLGCLRLFDN